MTTGPSARRTEVRMPRLRADRGSGAVAMVTLVFAFTFLGLVWLARDVDRAVSNRSAAQSIAFQAARAGAQSADVSDLRAGDDIPAIDPSTASGAAQAAAGRLFESYGVSGSVTSVVVDGDRVSVRVRIDDPAGAVTGAGTVRAERAP